MTGKKSTIRPVNRQFKLNIVTNVTTRIKTELKKLEKENKEKHIEEMKHLEKRAETLFDYLNLKYRLSKREIEVLILY